MWMKYSPRIRIVFLILIRSHWTMTVVVGCSRTTDGMQWNAWRHNEREKMPQLSQIIDLSQYFILFYFILFASVFIVSSAPIRYIAVLCSPISFRFSKQFHGNPLNICVYLFATIRTRWMCIFLKSPFLLLVFVNLSFKYNEKKRENGKINIKTYFYCCYFGFIL